MSIALEYKDFLMELADECDQRALYYFNSQQFDVQQKKDASPVTQADLEIETFIRDSVRSRYPEWGLLGEEFGASEQTQRCRLIVDPIDGTRNFIRGLPWFATLMAIEIDSVLTVGLVSAPATQDRWWAVLNQGAFHNGKPIQVSTLSDFSDSQFFYGSLYGPEAEQTPKTLQHVLALSHRQRGIGDYLMHMLVAGGAGEAAFDFGLKPWDKAPLKVIVEEAGGKATGLDGTFRLEDPSLICSNGLKHDVLLELLNK